jgi:LmbE family N-acetylglucosaminyl deacetylase
MNLFRGRRERLVGLLLVLLASQSLHAQTSQLPALSPRDRILILSPHPDDDILGCAGLIQTAVQMKLPLRVVYLTNGDNYEWAFMLYEKHPVLRPAEMRAMGEIRRQEAVNAEALLGVHEDQLTFLGYPDWGTEHIFMEHWGPERPAFRSMLTKVTEVPYKDAFHPGAPYKGESVLADLEKIIKEFRPTKIFVAHPADAQRDHRTFYAFTQVALWDLADQFTPEVYPFLIHHPRWPLPRGYRADRVLKPPVEFENLTWLEETLSEAQIAEKNKAIALHRTQMVKDHAYLESFIADNELFSSIPPIRPGSEEIHVSSTTTSEVQWHYLYLERDALVIRMEYSKHWPIDLPVNMYLFGYRHDRPFVDMPKLRLSVIGLHLRVYDQGIPVKNSGITISKEGRTLLVRIPLSALGGPDHLLGTSWSRSAEEPFEWRMWRAVDIQNPH